MKQLIENIKKSIYGPTYYQELLSRPASFSWKYYFAFTLTLTIFLTITLSVPLVPKVHQVARDLPEKFFAYYPDELEVRIDKGVASSNVVEPYFLPVPIEFKGSVRPQDSLGSLVVIDTKTPFSVAQFGTYKSALWLGRDQVAFFDDNGSIRIRPFEVGMNLTLNENVLRGFEQKLRPFYKFAAPAYVVLIFLGLTIVFGLKLLYLLFAAVLIFFLGRLLKQRWSYGASYRIGLHAVTLPLLLNMLLSFFYLPTISLPFLFTAIILAVVFVNYKDATPVMSTPLFSEKP
ncbi:MAG TPA: DUF1189 family protein [Candidatus Paceibacterota bacterium]